MKTTPKYALPYLEGTDPARDIPTQTKGIATTLEAIISSGDLKGAKGDQGLPGVNAVPADSAVATYVKTASTATAQAVATAATTAATAAAAPKADMARLPVRSQALERMSLLCHWQARDLAANETRYVQGFTINEDTQEVYVSAYDRGLSTPAQWIECRNYDGTLKWKSRNLATTSQDAYSEGCPYYYNAAGDLCFIVRLDVDDSGTPMGTPKVRVYNRTKDTLTNGIAVKGNSKLSTDGQFFYCTYSQAGSARLTTVYQYLLSSIDAGAPVLYNTIKMDTFGSPIQDEKPQGIYVHEGEILVATGKRDGADPAGNGKPGLRLHNASGRLVATWSMERKDFRVQLAKMMDPDIVNVGGVTYENEGCYVLSDGRVAMLHVMYGEAIITLHGTACDLPVKLVTPNILAQTPDLPIDLASGVTNYNASSPLTASRNGDMVTITGAVKGVVQSGTANVTIGTLPGDGLNVSSKGFRPATERVFIMPSNGSAYWRGVINPGGAIQLVRYAGGTLTAASWLPIDFTFRADGA